MMSNNAVDIAVGIAIATFGALSVGCQSGSNGEGSKPIDVATDASESDASADAGPTTAQLTHKFEPYELESGEETIPCVQWSLDNEKPLYVNKVTLANEGGFHHSNWYVVPEDYAAGEDGYFDCSERGYRGFSAAVTGTVLFAQSTQAQSEVQQLPDGVVTKIPPNHKIVADVHFLNISPRKKKTSARLTLGLLHPRDVETVATPFVLSYNDLHIPPKSEARFTSECNFESKYEDLTDADFDIKIYYVLPHYHGLGNYFSLERYGGPRGEEQLFELTGFNAEANGQRFSPPIELTDAKGLRFTCGYDNPRDEEVGWGIGGQEMCMMLGFSNAEAVMAGRVGKNNEVVREEDGIVYNEGPCTSVMVLPSEGQQMPSEEEKEGSMYVPESDSDSEIEPIPECEERSGTAKPLRPPTLSNLKTELFRVGCTFTSCHDSENPTGGLNLAADDLHDELMNHELSTPADEPLVDPGNPEGSWLYRVTSNCEPKLADGSTTSHMPRNSPTLLAPELLAMIREWIERGAKDN